MDFADAIILLITLFAATAVLVALRRYRSFRIERQRMARGLRRLASPDLTHVP